MNKKHIIILFAIAVLVTSAALLPNDDIIFNRIVDAAEQTTTITINSSVAATEEFAPLTYTHAENNNFVLSFDAVKTGGGVGTIKGGSYIRRTEISRNLKSITVNYASTGVDNELKVQTWYDANDVVKMTADLTPGKAYNLRGNYFCLIAGDKADIKIDSISLSFSCLAGTEATVTRTRFQNRGENLLLRDYCDMTGVFTWDDKTNKTSWYVIELELKNNQDWDSIYPVNDSGYLFGNDGSLTPRLFIDEVRLLSSGRMQLFCNIFKKYTGYVYENGDFWPHLSFHGNYWTAAPGDVKVSTVDGVATSDNGTPTIHKEQGGIEGVGTYKLWSCYSMPCLTITRN